LVVLAKLTSVVFYHQTHSTTFHPYLGPAEVWDWRWLYTRRCSSTLWLRWQTLPRLLMEGLCHSYTIPSKTKLRANICHQINA